MASIKSNFFQTVRTSERQITFRQGSTHTFKPAAIDKIEENPNLIVWVNAFPYLICQQFRDNPQEANWYFHLLYQAWLIYHFPANSSGGKNNLFEKFLRYSETLPVNFLPNYGEWAFQKIQLRHLRSRLCAVMGGWHQISPIIGWCDVEPTCLSFKIGEAIVGNKIPIFSAGIRIFSTLKAEDFSYPITGKELKQLLQGWPALLNFPQLTVYWEITWEGLHAAHLNHTFLGRAFLGKKHLEKVERYSAKFLV